MKSAGATYKKLKDVKFRYWIVLYRTLSKKSPCNCTYNYQYFINENECHKIGLCLLHQNNLITDEKINIISGVYPHLVDICQADGDCKNCNAFIPKYSRDDIKTLFIEELNNKKIKEKKYPDICALEWVLEQAVIDIPCISWIQKLYLRIKSFFILNPKNQNLGS